MMTLEWTLIEVEGLAKEARRYQNLGHDFTCLHKINRMKRLLDKSALLARKTLAKKGIATLEERKL